jgi:cyclic beta-1,2-glucan synthetase
MANPIKRSGTRADVQRYKVEPYAVAADVYSAAPHEGRGGWTWYTGAAGWLYRAGIEGNPGGSPPGRVPVPDTVHPCRMAKASKSISVFHSARYEILVVNQGASAIESPTRNSTAKRLSLRPVRIPSR